MFESAVDFMQGQTTESLLTTFWMLLLVEMPRFFLAGVIVGWFIVTRRPANRRRLVYNGGITAIVAGHNGAESLARTVRSLRQQAIGALQLIVINDGSTDATDDACRTLQRQGLIDHYVRLHGRGGKAAAVNLALGMARHPLFLVTDADTTFDRDAIAVAAAHFVDPSVGVVGGTLRVRNVHATLATRVQHINYAFSITLGRIVKDMLGFYFVASGAFALYRTEAVKGVGGWDFGPGEDGDIMTRLRLAGWRARFAPFAVAMTDVPDTFPALARQRLRWDRSLIRNRWRKAGPYVLDPRNASFDFAFAISFLDIFFFSALVPFLFLVYAAQLIASYGPFSMPLMLAVSAFYIVLGLIKYTLALAVSTRPRDDLPLILYVPLYSMINLYVLRWVKLFAVSNELIFRGSYTDGYVPAKVRRCAKRF